MKGPALLLAGTISFSLLDAIGKLLSGSFSLAQAVGTRWAMVVVLILGLRLVVRQTGGPLRTSMPWLHVLRSGVMMFSAAGFYLGFRSVPLAEGYLVFFTAPFMTLALTPLLLKERVPGAAWLWSTVGFVGVLISVLQKLGDGGSVSGYLFILMGTIAAAVTQAMNRMMRAEAGWARMVFWTALLGFFIYAPVAALDWVRPQPLEWAMLAASGVFAAGGVVLSAAAYRLADAARLGPYGFAVLPVSVLLDWLIWHRAPDLATLVGGSVVVFACVMSERARRRALLQAMVLGIPEGKSKVPSGPSRNATTERTAASGSGP